MRITEDKADREALFHQLTRERFAVRAKGYDPAPVVGWPRKHQLWPCVRLGAGDVWLSRTRRPGAKAPPRKSQMRRALAFLRGHSHEALMADKQSLVFIYEGVGNEVDEWTGEPEAPFTEIKSTNLSSKHMWAIIKVGKVDLLTSFGKDAFFMGYFLQSCQNAVATGVDRCRLRIMFMNGDYASRRTKCPECKGKLGPMKDISKTCTKCGYKSYSIDLRSYILVFTKAEMAYFRHEVFKVRRDQFNRAVEATSKEEVLKLAPPTKCFLCTECDVGKQLGCENYGG